MFFYLSKILDLTFAPLSWVIALLVLLLLRPSWSAQKRAFVIVPLIAMLYGLSIEPVSNRLIRSLETPMNITYKESGPPYDAVVLLGGLVDTKPTTSSHTTSYSDNSERLLRTFEILREGRAKNVIISSGEADDSGVNEAYELSKQLVKWGIAKERILIEGKSRNTRENAVFSTALAHEQGLTRLLIVTSAFHMTRARGCFLAAGVDADVLAADYRSFDPGQFEPSLLPRAGHFHQSTWVLREWAGRLVYRLRGYTSEIVAPTL
jgi:uncharacterized SAM-binding protein YcdF (DUF218 family)